LTSGGKIGEVRDKRLPVALPRGWA